MAGGIFTSNTTLKMQSGGEGSGTTLFTTASNEYAIVTFQCGASSGNSSQLDVGSISFTMTTSATFVPSPANVYVGPSTAVTITNISGSGTWSYVIFKNSP